MAHMRKVYLLFCYLQLLSTYVSVYGFNMDLHSPVVRSIPQTDSYFGYSLAMHRENGVNKIVVGAPRHQTSASGVDRGGAIFDCPVLPYNGTTSCQELTQFNGLGNDFDSRGRRTADQSGQWFGASVKSSGEDGIILACRPLYTWYLTANYDEREPIGGCFVARNEYTDIRVYEPCRASSSREWSIYGITHCQAGIGADINENEIFVGAPGSFFWQGQIWVVNHDLTSQRRTNEGRASFDDSYRGYAVAMGDFKGDSRSEYAVGIPRAIDSLGMVSIYDNNMNAYLNLTGYQIGAYFGHSLAVSDLNDDGLNDIVVGAPMFIDEEKTTNGWEIGKVFIYYNDGSGGFTSGSTMLGYQVKSRFGNTIAALGDVNQDGYNDLAISAPYGGKLGDGVVYIYHGKGRTLGLSSTPIQTLEPSSFGLKMSGFGYSLSAGMDMDDNMYPDLAIGAYKSAKAVIVRSRPVIDVTGSLSPSPSSIVLLVGDSNKLASFNLSVCLQYTGTNVPDSIEIRYEVVLDYSRATTSRALFDLAGEKDASSHTKTVPLKSNKQTCTLYDTYVRSSITDKLSPIGVSLNFALADETPAAGEILPILDEQTSTYTSISVPIQRNCANETCVPNLNIQAKTDTISMLVGASESVNINVSMANTGEDAYQSVLTVNVPEELHYVGFTRVQTDQIVTCTNNIQMSKLTCDVGNPFLAGTTAKINIQFSSDNLPGNRESLPFTLTIGSVEDELSTEDNSYNVTVLLRVDAELSFYGSSNPDKVIFEEEHYELSRAIVYEDDAGPEVNHKFSLYNNGPSKVGETEVLIHWPMMYDEGSQSYLLYLISATMDTGDACTIVGNDDFNPENLQSNSSDATGTLRRRRAFGSSTPLPPAPGTTDSGMLSSTTAPTVVQRDISCTGNQLQYCYTIRCVVDSLGAGTNAARDNVGIDIKSRVWTNTLISKSTEVYILISAQAQVKSVPYVTQLDHEINVTSNEVATDIIPQYKLAQTESQGIPLWIYLVSALGGVLILVLMVVILHCLGFFKRKKISPGQRQSLVQAARDNAAMEDDTPEKN